MPGPLVIPLIAAGAGLASQGINAAATGANNRKARKYADKAYARERADNLADYTMQNEYNSPQSQMERLRKAGLNPNLVYENGAATATAAPIRTADTKSVDFKAPQFDLQSPMMNYVDIKQREAQTDNLKAQNTVLLEESLLKKAQTVQTLAQTDFTKINTGKSQFELDLAKSLRQNSLDVAAANLNKTLADTDMTVWSNTRAEQFNNMAVSKMAEEILTIQAQRTKIPLEKQQLQAQIRNLAKDGRLKDIETELRDAGLTPSDPAYQRLALKLIQKLFPNLNVSPLK